MASGPPVRWRTSSVRRPHAWRRLKSLTVPVLGVRAELSDFVSKASWDKWRRLREQDAFAVLPGVGHLAPLEAPRKTAHVVADWLHSRPGN
jgi:pimeloyl-ACP methyl ester carboxylesterase